jgi:hypothetical protein
MIFANCALDSTITKANEPAESAELNPPQWPKSVAIITSDMSDEQAQDMLNGLQETPVQITSDMTEVDYLVGTKQFVPTEHFSSERKAIFFEPREEPYRVDVQVGYYVQVAGLGASAKDVKFDDATDGTSKKGPYCPAYFNMLGRSCTSLDTFWRSAENFTNLTKDGQLWAVSQAAPIRRIHSVNGLLLHDKGAQSSGGHLANVKVDGAIVFGSQQQFCSRSLTVGANGAVNLGAWSNVFVDTVAPEDCLKTPTDWHGVPFSQELSLGTRPYNWRVNWDNGSADQLGPSTTVNVPTTTVEKCFVAMETVEDGSKKYFLHVPRPRIRTGDSPSPLGADLEGSTDDRRPFENVYVALAEVGDDIDYDVARKINMALRQGKDVVLSPGIYHLKESINIIKNDQVLLGIGMATLTAPTNGEPCIRVAAGTEGVRVGGIMFAASRITKGLFSPKTTAFIEFGKEGEKDLGNPTNPGVLSDIFCRVGGDIDREVSTDVMVRIHQGNVIGDNLWLWRADHVALAAGESPNFPDMNLDYHQVVMGECPGKTGLEVNGDNVVIHGLAVEHTTEDQVVWNGNDGQVYFYQCELPYDVDQNFGAKNFVGFRVTGKNHQLGGAGIYCNFRDYNVIVKTGIVHPNAFDASKVINPFIVHLNNGGRIMTVVSDGFQYRGGPVYDKDHMLSKYVHSKEDEEAPKKEGVKGNTMTRPTSLGWISDKLASMRGSRSNSPTGVAAAAGQ